MKLFRFMSLNEFIKYKNGEILINNTDYNREKNLKSYSKGFCFLNYAHYKPEIAFHFINGCTGKIFEYDICVIFETNRNNVVQSRARYAEPVKPTNAMSLLNRKSFIAKEYCTTTYDKEKFKLISIAKIEWNNWEKWDWKNNI